MIGVAIVLEAAKEGMTIAEAGWRLARDQLRADEAEGLPAAERRRRFDEISEATRQLEST